MMMKKNTYLLTRWFDSTVKIFAAFHLNKNLNFIGFKT